MRHARVGFVTLITRETSPAPLSGMTTGLGDDDDCVDNDTDNWA